MKAKKIAKRLRARAAQLQQQARYPSGDHVAVDASIMTIAQTLLELVEQLRPTKKSKKSKAEKQAAAEIKQAKKTKKQLKKSKKQSKKQSKKESKKDTTVFPMSSDDAMKVMRANADAAARESNKRS
jgi:aspartokinase